jgi:hypothetical protein
MAARLEVSTEDSDNFHRNKITVLCEKRVALGTEEHACLHQGRLQRRHHGPDESEQNRK